MTEISENDEARLRDLYLDKSGARTVASARADDDPVESLARRSSRQTGMRDLLVLAVSSLFALLLIFFSPLAGLSGRALGKRRE